MALKIINKKDLIRNFNFFDILLNSSFFIKSVFFTGNEKCFFWKIFFYKSGILFLCKKFFIFAGIFFKKNKKINVLSKFKVFFQL